jgi:hypothetical protein
MAGVWRGSGGNRHVSGREEEVKKNGSGKLWRSQKWKDEGSKKGRERTKREEEVK